MSSKSDGSSENSGSGTGVFGTKDGTVHNTGSPAWDAMVRAECAGVAPSRAHSLGSTGAYAVVSGPDPEVEGEGNNE
jgi:hypothetical protein